MRLLSEATSLLKSLKPQTKAIRLKRVGQVDGPTGLLDGGATHALRRGDPQELATSESVLVELAHGSIELKQHPLTGTILTDHAVEPIVPLRGLIELGFVIKWGSQGCEIKHPSRGTINCWLRNGCPVVSEKHALGLIQDIENMELAKRIPMNPKVQCPMMSQHGGLKGFLKSRNEFGDTCGVRGRKLMGLIFHGIGPSVGDIPS